MKPSGTSASGSFGCVGALASNRPSPPRQSGSAWPEPPCPALHRAVLRG
eukprot:CAMPEP_0177438052 /NCGR_PEP_ID=MMETSP0369-20130122/2540_1 /TAXON_ID=447022 ORGANISM="Scrippsiella hangoei-like, Strain SHHI-4" /NCGR_SAMPLE_ID=MMETSP0369 /ASSEMBLY_ACC=CAM_ASM_000364 /LENGTH=48 /DNA_ID= /DNA_START= /DNA_END= /DNA_ORIENTATION=